MLIYQQAHPQAAINAILRQLEDDDRRRGLGPLDDERFFRSQPHRRFRMRIALPLEIAVAIALAGPPDSDDFIWMTVRQLASGEKEKGARSMRRWRSARSTTLKTSRKNWRASFSLRR